MTKNDPYACFEAAGLAPADEPILKQWPELDEVRWPLSDDAFADMCDYLTFNPELKAAVVKSHQAMRNDEHLELIARFIYARLIFGADQLYFFPTDPTDKAVELTLDPLINVPIFVHAAARLPELYKAHGWSDEQCRDTLSDLALWIDDHYQKHAQYGFTKMHWCRIHWQMRLLKVGRLQFEPMELADHIYVLRHRERKEIKIINVGQHQFCSDGLYASCNTKADPQGETVWEQTDAALRCHPFNSDTGHLENDPVDFNLDEWEVVVRGGDRLLSVHIPATGPMTIEACAESFEQALPIFTKLFSNDKNPEIKGFYCSSWLLNPHFATYLKFSSNMVQFMCSWHLFARPKTTGKEFFYRVWGQDEIDIKTAAKETSLQKAIIKHIKSGGTWNDMGGVLLSDELPFGPLA